MFHLEQPNYGKPFLPEVLGVEHRVQGERQTKYTTCSDTMICQHDPQHDFQDEVKECMLLERASDNNLWNPKFQNHLPDTVVKRKRKPNS